MIPTLNPILFFIAALFGTQGVFVSEEVHLRINFTTNTGIIEYFDISIPYQAEQKEKIAEYAKHKIREIDHATVFDSKISGITLEVPIIEKMDGKLNATICFSFDDKNKMLDVFRFNKTHYGKSTTSDSFSYYVLHTEELILSNGSSEIIEDAVVLEWDKEVKEIELHLKQGADAKQYLGELKSIAEYWKE